MAFTPNQLGNQLESIVKNFSLSAIKIGMLYSPENVNITANFLRNQINVPIIVDPVIVSSGGEPLITDQALNLITEKILPLASLITPNRYELETLTNRKVMNFNDAFNAAQAMAEKYKCRILLKGGHFEGTILNDFIIGEAKLLRYLMNGENTNTAMGVAAFFLRL